LKHNTIRQSDINTIVKNEKSYPIIDVLKNINNLIQVDKRLLNIGSKIDFKLFSLDDKTHMSLFLQSDSIIDEDKKQKLKTIEKIFALKSEIDKYNIFLELHIQDILKDDTLSLDEKTEIIYESSTDLTKDLYNNPDALKNAKLSENIVKPVLQSIIHNHDTISSYIKIIEYDYYTHTHSLNVSVYSLCLGAELGLSEDVLVSLGRAALLHDIGKSKIDSKIVNKNGKLSDEEFEMMKNHPSYGYKLAKEYKINDKDILDGIHHHHEKIDGRGYPNKLRGDQITLFPRIISICDVFDALTTRRSYKKAMSSYNALVLMQTNMSSHLDKSLLKKFIRMLHK
jgi:putative nucleotidyltransferase with HDIG domain